ncbi:hypothetical protein GCM10017600_18140 [Streptosporangium carneum]|uniref:Uncharacterized protein n=2 Tax=Streptosporangium carneum TaxID=47481 RepID=A0A9W6MBJ8_9ACTN|nr:hypothetical protein GCM10017600_18140 [Streptosporangium carneum]
MGLAGRGAALAAAMLVGGVLTAGGAALATAMNQEAIHGCVTTATGALRVVAEGTACEEGETALDWNRQGPPGQFAVFPIKGEGGAVAPGATRFFKADCGGGNYALSGGYLGTATTAPVSVIVNTMDSKNPSTWKVGVVNHSQTETYKMVTYASCVPVAAQ